MAGATVKVDTTKKSITITLPIQKPTPSASGKTMVIATTHGNQITDAVFDGHPVTIGVTAYFKA